MTADTVCLISQPIEFNLITCPTTAAQFAMWTFRIVFVGSVRKKKKKKIEILNHLKLQRWEGRKRAQGLKPRSGTLDSPCQLVHDSILNTTAGGLQTPRLQPPGCEMTSPLIYRQLTRGRGKQRDSGNWRWNWRAYRYRGGRKKSNNPAKDRVRVRQKTKKGKQNNKKEKQQMSGVGPGPGFSGSNRRKQQLKTSRPYDLNVLFPKHENDGRS